MTGDQVHNEFSGNAAGNVVQVGRVHGDIIIHPLPQNSPIEQLLAHDLAKLVADGWRDEAADRDLLNPEPLPVNWSVEASAVADSAARPAVEEVGSITELAAVFKSSPRRRLVLLGEPGAGKTSTVLLLMSRLLTDRQAAAPVPVLMQLASWEFGLEHLGDWLERNVAERFPKLGATHGMTAAAAAAELRRAGLLLPMLDGLDEMPESYRARVIAYLNQRLLPTDSVILTSRAREYEIAATEDDVLHAAVVLRARAIEPAALRTYLLGATAARRRDRWTPVFDVVGSAPTGPVATALSTPLMIWLAMRVYARQGSADPAELVDAERFSSRTSIENHLLDEIVRAAFADDDPSYARPYRRWRPWKPEQARRWLRFLAARCTALDTQDIAWWKLRDTLGVRFVVTPIFVAFVLSLAIGTVGLIAGALAPSTASGHSSDLDYANYATVGLIGGTAVVVLGAMLGASFNVHHRALRTVRTGRVLIAFALSAGLLAAVRDPRWWVLEGPVGALIMLAWTDVRLRRRYPGERSADPVRALRRARRAFFLSVIAYGLVAGLLAGGLASLGATSYRLELVAGLSGALAGVMLNVVTRAWPQWLLAKAYFAATGRTPWSLMRFLRDAHTVGLLRRVGAVYQFRHLSLQLGRATASARADRLGRDGAAVVDDVGADSEFLRIVRMRTPSLWVSAIMIAFVAMICTVSLRVAVPVAALMTAVFIVEPLMRHWTGRRILDRLPTSQQWRFRIAAEAIELESIATGVLIRLNPEDVDRVAVRPCVSVPVPGAMNARWYDPVPYAVYVRLRPGVAAPPRKILTPDADGWYPILGLRRRHQLPDGLNEALRAFAGARWEPPITYR